MPSAPRSEIHRRIKAFQSKLARSSVDAALIVQRADLYYFSGTGQDAHLLIPIDGMPVLMVRRSFERAIEDSPLDNVVPLSSLSELSHIIKGFCDRPVEYIGNGAGCSAGQPVQPIHGIIS